MKFPNSSLKVEPRTFTSRYSDPAHPASNGALLGLLSGGNIDIPTAITHGKGEKGKEAREEDTEDAEEKTGEADSQ